MTRRLTPSADRWALDTGTAVAASRGRVNVVANATLTPERARDLARRLDTRSRDLQPTIRELRDAARSLQTLDPGAGP